MTQRSLGRGAGIMAAKSCFRLEKWLNPVNRNMITRARRAASLQEESRLTPSAPNPRRTMDEMTRTNKDIMWVSFPRGQVIYPPLMSRPSVGRSTSVAPPDFCLPAVTDGRRLDSWLLEPLLHLLRFSAGAVFSL